MELFMANLSAYVYMMTGYMICSPDMNTFIRQKRQRQKDRQKKAVYICKLKANYNTQRTNDHENWS